MSTFDKQFAALARGPLQDRFGISVTRKPSTGSNATFTCISWMEDRVQDEQQDTGREGRRTGTLKVSAADVATESLKTSYTINGEDWAVESFGPQNVGGIHELRMVRHESIEHTNRGYRSQR